MGNHSRVIGELETLIRENPYRERLRGLQMLALYRSGRQAEALRAYQRARILLAEELGIDPSAELRDLEQRILDHDRTLDLPREVSPPVADRLPSPLVGAGSVRAVRGYELRQQVGEGDFGVVYRAYQPSVGREVAIKVIRPEYVNRPDFVRRFEAEAQLIAQLEHPHVVGLLDFWRDPDGAYLVMPCMRGGSLAETLRHGPRNLAAALRLLDEVGRALGYAHRRGVIHRDLKPGNVVARRGRQRLPGRFRHRPPDNGRRGAPRSPPPSPTSRPRSRGARCSPPKPTSSAWECSPSICSPGSNRRGDPSR